MSNLSTVAKSFLFWACSSACVIGLACASNALILLVASNLTFPKKSFCWLIEPLRFKAVLSVTVGVLTLRELPCGGVKGILCPAIWTEGSLKRLNNLGS